MNNIKIRYTFRHKGSGNIEMKWYSIVQLEARAATELSPAFSDEYELVSRDLYTGLKDKNGREIYEGDIVFYDRNIAPSIDSRKYVVKWEDSKFVLTNSSETIDDFTSDIIEIIGDVYRNPNLLEAAE